MSDDVRLSGAEEIELIRTLNSTESDIIFKATLDKLVLANLGLCHKVVQKFPVRTNNCTYDDLLHESIAGLIHGIKKFDPARGYRLSTYVYPWVRNYVQRYYQNHGKTIRVPSNLAERQMTLNKKIESLIHDLGREPTMEELSESVRGHHKLDGKVESVLSSMTNTVSLNEMMSESSELECLVGEDHTEDIENEVEIELLLDKLKTLVPDRDYNMFVLRYGLTGEIPYTLQDCADKFELTRARCHQIEHGILKKLRTLV